MITDEADPRMAAAAVRLQARLKRLCVGRPIDRTLIYDIQRLLYDYRVGMLQDGLDWPHLVPIVVPRLGVIHVARADLDLVSIRRQVIQLVRFNPDVTPDEVAHAVRWAWDIKPGALVDEGEHVRERDQAKAIAAAV